MATLLLALIAVALMAAFLGVSRLLGRKQGYGGSFTGYFIGEGTSWTIVFSLGLTVFAGMGFWAALMAGVGTAVAIFSLGMMAIGMASFLIATLRDQAAAQPDDQEVVPGASMIEALAQYRNKPVPQWALQYFEEEATVIWIEDEPWTINHDGVLVRYYPPDPLREMDEELRAADGWLAKLEAGLEV